MPYQDKATKRLHHKRWRDVRRQQTKIDPRITTLMKICTSCKTEKSSSEFYIDYGSQFNLSSWCKRCQLSRQRIRRYGIDFPDDWDCEICGEPGTDVDHDKNEQWGFSVRGLLCGKCNRGLGNFKHNVYHLNQAIQYMQRYHNSGHWRKIVEIG